MSIETPPPTAESAFERMDVMTAVFGVWMVAGLFVDGWAHNAEKPETFFTPWHGLLYSGFAAAVAWGLWRGRSTGGVFGTTGDDAYRLSAIGLGVFAVGAAGDLVWHSLFGVEVDIEALISPTHLALMIGGLLALGGPWRSRQAAFLPATICLFLMTAVVGFFFQYATPFRNDHMSIEPVFEEAPPPTTGVTRTAHGFAAELLTATGILSVLASTVVLFGAAAFVLRRRSRPPAGTFTLLFGAHAVALGALDTFDEAGLAVLAGAVGGAALDALVRGGTVTRRAFVASAVALWASYVALFAVARDMAWPIDLWGGAIVLAALAAYVLGLLGDGRRQPDIAAAA